MPQHDRRIFLGPTLRAAIVAVLLAVAVALFDMGGQVDLTRFLRVGEVASAREFVQADLPDSHLVPGWGHDGQANYVLARVFPNLADADGVLDSVTYRSRRIVYPALVSWLPSGMPMVVGLWLVNLMAIGAAAAAIAHIARSHGASWLAGAAVGLTPAFLTSMVVDLGDALAFAFGAAGIVAWRRDRSTAVAIALFTLSALTRETALIIPAAVFLAEGRGRRMHLLIPPMVVAIWILVLDLWIGGAGKSAAQFRLPFLGWVDQGLSSPEIAVAFAFLIGSLWIAAKLWPHDRTWSYILLFDLAVLTVVDRAVLFSTLNLSRVTPWVVPLAVLAVTAQWPSPDKDTLGSEAHPPGQRLVDRTLLGHV